MTTIGQFRRTDLHKQSPLLSSLKVTIESAFYGSNVTKVEKIATAYANARHARTTIVTNMPVSHAKDLELPEDAVVLVNNDGKIVGRTAAARVIAGMPGVDNAYYAGVIREALFKSLAQDFYQGDVFVGLSTDFSCAAHLLLPHGYENNFYSYLLNFQIANDEQRAYYGKSKPLPENDIFIFANPDWSHPDFPNGLAFFDPEHNVAEILGLRYFGELKKATLTLAWATAHRHGFVACHGGMKQYSLPNKKFTMAAFGLSGSGKSTITLSKPSADIPVTVLHDDAFVINQNTGATTALEPAYFDKTQDYPASSPDLDYFLTVQNVGVTLDENGQRIIVTEDIRNGNGRTIKSRYVTPNRVDYLPESIDAVFWIMKDDSLPPVIKISDPELATIFGVTLATKRSTAENVVGKVDLDKLVIEPFANPFRAYPLSEDYAAFKQLFESGVVCYILNTGFFNGRKVTPHETLSSIDKIIQDQAEFRDFGPIARLSYLALAEHPVNFNDAAYLNKIKLRLLDRKKFIAERDTLHEGYDALPADAAKLMDEMILDITQRLVELGH